MGRMARRDWRVACDRVRDWRVACDRVIRMRGAVEGGAAVHAGGDGPLPPPALTTGAVGRLSGAMLRASRPGGGLEICTAMGATGGVAPTMMRPPPVLTTRRRLQGGGAVTRGDDGLGGSMVAHDGTAAATAADTGGGTGTGRESGMALGGQGTRRRGRPGEIMLRMRMRSLPFAISTACFALRCSPPPHTPLSCEYRLRVPLSVPPARVPPLPLRRSPTHVVQQHQVVP